MNSLSPQKNTTESIASITNLCTALSISIDELNTVLQMEPSEWYVKDYVPKSDGSERVIYKPHHLLRRIQRRINKRILSRIIKWPEFIYGSVPNEKVDANTIIRKDYVSCAAKHCGAKSILKVDIKDFFDNIQQYHVLNIFRGFFNYSDEVSKTLANLCCYNERVVQGALTSSYIASLCLWDVETEVVKRLMRHRLVYTRLVDDITVSSTVSNFQFDSALSYIRSMLEGKDLPLNMAKTKSLYVSVEPLLVHGMRVNFPEPRYPSDEIRKLRASVHNLERLASQVGYRTTYAYRTDFNRCMGRVNKLKRVGHNKHAVLLKKLKKILPLPSKTDLKRINVTISRLESDFDRKRTRTGIRKDILRRMIG
ncbi:Retron-type reverse transcriptase [Plesiomonas shigelloides]|uniref:reverse transcriptase family protein n=1 Tax=Plesiomonas shigelloides TaxID=703 RepID=UPI000E004FDD|nr:reverse transcriptase family protein [Plesiomonas shigelloides]SUB63528.1 Retron-type reverse transcriptase [Plesiomonas shigelloides]